MSDAFIKTLADALTPLPRPASAKWPEGEPYDCLLNQPGAQLLIFAPRGPAQAGLLALAEDMRRRGARVLVAAPVGTPGAELPLVAAGHEDLDPISAIQSYYLAVEALARAKGLDPDKPRHLNKVTLTH